MTSEAQTVSATASPVSRPTKQRRGLKLTYGQVSKMLRYEPSTGKLYWKTRPVMLFNHGSAYDGWNEQYAGQEAFTSTDGNGSKRGGILGRTYLAHRVIWLLHYGSWPTSMIRHRNGNNSDNRICNLSGRLPTRKTKTKRVSS
jgi:HNH endonuclease